MTITVLPGLLRPLIGDRLLDNLDVRWFMTKDEALAFAPEAEIGWFDFEDKEHMRRVIEVATRMTWLNSIYSGIEHLPVASLQARGVAHTNGAGINALTIAEYVVMGMLTVAKGYDHVVRARDRHEWLTESPGRIELAGSRALLLGAGAIGGLVRTRLEAFDVAVTTVRRTPGSDELGPNEWQPRLGDFDWIIVAVPATAETEAMIGAAELATMKPEAVIVNVARGSVIDQPALVDALTHRRIAAAFLDVTTPEPLPAEHPLWSLPNAHLSMHLSGRAQTKMFVRAAERFLANLARWQASEPLSHQVDLSRGY